MGAAAAAVTGGNLGEGLGRAMGGAGRQPPQQHEALLDLVTLVEGQVGPF